MHKLEHARCLFLTWSRHFPFVHWGKADQIINELLYLRIGSWAAINLRGVLLGSRVHSFVGGWRIIALSLMISHFKR